MWGASLVIEFPFERNVTVEIPRAVLESIYSECDSHDTAGVETGGRLLGTYRRDGSERLIVRVEGMIDAGGRSRRGHTHLYQDGEYQERIFRSIEAVRPEIEHFGTWHTHHVNGYPDLSAGDVATYRRTVNHQNQNTDFWYALLVTRKVPRPQRYLAKHYVLFRGNPTTYRIPDAQVSVVDDEPLWIPGQAAPAPSQPKKEQEPKVVMDTARAIDQRVLEQLYPEVKPYFSQKLGSIYWKGSIRLVNGESATILVAPEPSQGSSLFLVKWSLDELQGDAGPLPTPWQAVRVAEVELNGAVFIRASRPNKGESTDD